MAVWANKNGTWTNVPEQADRIWVPSAGSWRSVKAVWGAEEVTPGVYQWTRVWKVPDPAPAGVTVTVIQTQFLGGPVDASWTNTTNVDDMQFEVEWFINNSSYTTSTGNVNGSNTAQSIELAEGNFSNNDEVKARMRYVSGGVAGTYGDFSSTITYLI